MRTRTFAICHLPFAILLLAAAVGCARFSTQQTDISYDEAGQPIREVTTRAEASTLFTSKSALANFKASQTDKTQGASVGSLTQETSGTNAVEALKQINQLLRTLGGMP